MAVLMIIPVFAFILVMAIILVAIKNKGKMDAEGPQSTRNALRILDERFARGEIDEMEYIRKKDMLRRDR